MINSGTYQLNLADCAARPDVERGPRLRLEGTGLGCDQSRPFAGSPIPSILSAVHQPWMQVAKWDEKPAFFTVATTDHHIPRPLERSP